MSSRKRKRRCATCGEQGRLACVALMVDGKRVARWRVCLGCAAMKIAAIHAH